jgi:hypothetical protein
MKPQQFSIARVIVAAAPAALVILLTTSEAISAPIQPNELSGLTYWVKADAGVTESGGFVSQWADQSSSGINVANEVGPASQPNLVSVTNGSQTFNAIRFDTDAGETDVLSVGGVAYPATNATGGTVFVVQSFKTADTDNYTFSFGTSNGNKFVSGGAPGSQFYSGVRVGNNSSGTYFTRSLLAPAIDTVYVSALSWDPAPSSTAQRILLPDGSFSTDAVQTGTVAEGGSWATTASVFLGQLLGATVNAASVDVAEVIVFDHNLQLSEIEGVSEYLGAKYGVLATGHPGDFDGDGNVDGDDFGIWQMNFPTASGAMPSQGDADGDGDVDGADFVVWQTNFPFPSGSEASTVPEPRSLVLLLLASTAAVLYHGRVFRSMQ